MDVSFLWIHAQHIYFWGWWLKGTKIIFTFCFYMYMYMYVCPNICVPATYIVQKRYTVYNKKDLMIYYIQIYNGTLILKMEKKTNLFQLIENCQFLFSLLKFIVFIHLHNNNVCLYIQQFYI